MKLCSTVSLLSLFSSTLGSLQPPTLDNLARDVERVESVREIKDVTRTFSQLVQYGRWKDVASLFANDGQVRVGNITTDMTTAKGPAAVEKWIRDDHDAMDGSRPGALSTWLVDQPVTTLATDGQTAKARWLVLRLLGDGAGQTRIQGGIFENEYVKEAAGWKFSLLHYFPMFDGDYAEGWLNTGEGQRLLSLIPYHFTADSAGIPVLAGPTAAKAPPTTATAENLAGRIARLSDEDAVRNLQHAYGFYVDRRMWTDVVDLFAQDASIITDGVRFNGTIREELEQMGPEDLSRGILNDHPILDTIVYVHPNGQEATTRGFELGMIGNMNTGDQRWEFNIFRNTFTKDPATGIWKFKQLDKTRLLHADYVPGWSTGGILPSRTTAATPPPFLDITRRARVPTTPTTANLTSLAAALARAAAFDGIENISGAYGFFADDIRCQAFADLHHLRGHKESPFVGWYQTRARIAQACLQRYATFDPAPQRPRVPYHWRPQPVVLVAADGRSATLRARLLQWGTSNATRAGFPGISGFNGAVYHDQFALEDVGGGEARWRLWSLTIDEFYWQSVGFKEGWAPKRDLAATAAAAAAAPTSTVPGSAVGTDTASLASAYPPDLALTDPGLGVREVGFVGGVPPVLNFPDIKPMWFSYRNPVSGRVPGNYWPGCVPCGARKDWSLEAAGYQEPSTGPKVLV